MNYVFLDTCSWIYFASGKNEKSKHDFSDVNWQNLRSLLELKEAGSVLFLKNEIVDTEFKNASIEPFIEAFEKNVLTHIKDTLDSRVIVHCDNQKSKNLFRQAILSIEQVRESFQVRSNQLHEKVLALYSDSLNISISEKLKQKALQLAIHKNHFLFRNKKNNVNDYLILYSIQEWINSFEELKYLDETNDEHAVFFVTTNISDFGINAGSFNRELGLSQLIKPVMSLSSLVSLIRQKGLQSQNFLPIYQQEASHEIVFSSPLEEVIGKLNRVITLKRELFLSFIKKCTDQLSPLIKLRYVVKSIRLYHPSSKLDLPGIRSQNIANGRLQLDSQSKLGDLGPATISQKGDLLMIGFGPRSGEYCINSLEDPVAVSYSVRVIRLDTEKIDLEYLDYILRIVDMGKFYNLDGKRRFDFSKFLNQKIPIPSLGVQRRMVLHFQEKEKEIEIGISMVKRKINTLLI